MIDLVSELAAKGRSLPPEERVRLLDLLLESLDDASSGDIEQAWKQEIERRVASHDRGEGKLYELDEVMAEASRIHCAVNATLCAEPPTHRVVDSCQRRSS